MGRAAATLSSPRPAELRLAGRAPRPPAGALLVAILVVAAALRVWRLNEVGFNSDEAVYAGQGAAIAGDHDLEPLFPVFRAHPLLFQTLLSVGFRLHLGEGFERLSAAVLGVATVYLVFELGRLLYGRTVGLLAALLIALMPYHVVVTRQVLLDGPMTLFATLTLVLIARFAIERKPGWLYAAGAAMGLTFLSKETSVVLLGAVYAFLALTPGLGARLRDLAISLAVFAVVIAPFPLSLMLAGRSGTGESYLTWQLFRRPNHDLLFYPQTLPEMVGPLVLLAAAMGLWLLRRQASWRETLLLCWIVVPLAFFQLWPVKGFQYLLPAAPALAVLAARILGARWSAAPAVGLLATAIVAISLVVPTWGRIGGSAGVPLLAGAGGLPGGRETGRWIDRRVPAGSTFMTIGPSMANLVRYYGHRRAYGLSVSPNPLNRNPSYEPLANPDQALRDGEVQYLVWDAYSAGRSVNFSRRLLDYARRYGGRAVHSELVPATTPRGVPAKRPAIVVFEARP
jgi:Dolichyl-phosphate-mannose-protein mannosyltransferase